MILFQCVVLTALAAPPTLSDDAGRRLQAAQSALGDGDFDTCLKEVSAGTPLTQDDATLSQLYLTQGRCLGALQRYGQVEEAFSRALAHDPEARLDPNRVLPALVVMLDSLRSRLRGTLQVDSQPDSAQLEVDGVPKGPTPARILVPIGRHHVRARSSDSALVGEGDTVVRPNQTTPLRLTLIRRVTSTPPPGAAEPPVALQLDVLGMLDPINGFAAAAGPSLRGHFWFAAAHASFGLNPGVDAQVGFRTPNVAGPLGAFAHADGRLLFLPSGTIPGAGGGAGIYVTASSRFEVFGQVGVTQYLTGPPQTTLWTLATGVRIRIL
jgi:hypothetical protein